VSIADTPEGFVVSHQVHRGNPDDAQTLEAAIGGAQGIGMRVTSVLADRGYGDVVGDDAPAACGITDSVIPRKGNAHPKQNTRAWRRRYRWVSWRGGADQCSEARAMDCADRGSRANAEPRPGPDWEF
jgi:hypothetical protein